MSYMPSCGVRRPSVSLSVNICANCSPPRQWLDRHQICTRWSPYGGLASRMCSRSRSRSKLRALLWFLKKNHFFSQENAWIVTKLTPLLTSLPFFRSFFSAPQSQMAEGLCCEFCHSSHHETVCQAVCYTVRSRVCLRPHTLWSTITLSFQTQYQATKSNVYMLEWATPSLTVWFLIPCA